MNRDIQLVFDSNHPNLEALKGFLYNSLASYQLDGDHDVDEVLEKAYVYAYAQYSSLHADPNTIVEIEVAWLKTTCLEIIEELSRQRANKQRFSIAIAALCDIQNPEARSLFANIARTLRQYRLAGTYEVREIIAECYARGIRHIEDGKIIEKPLPWMRGTSLYVIRELRRKQDQADQPKLDGDGLTVDEAWSDLTRAEDYEALRLALERLSPEECNLLHERYINNRSWQKIGESLPHSSEDGLNANAARQRGFRALQKLRQHYEQIRPEVKLIDDSDGSESAS